MDKRIVFVALLPLMLSVVAAGVIGYLLLERPLVEPAPFVYMQQTFSIDGAKAVCAGDTIRWRSLLRVRQAPVSVITSASLYSWDRHTLVAAAKRSDAVEGTLWETGVITLANSYTLPPTLAPGRYTLGRSTAGRVTGDAIYGVPFTIRSDCELQR